MNKFAKALITMSETMMENNGYVRSLVRRHGGEISHRTGSKRG
ncbi:MAG: hypothetical protein ACOYIE_01235 [Agathobaculum sp.]|jgi:hypothetical protein